MPRRTKDPAARVAAGSGERAVFDRGEKRSEEGPLVVGALYEVPRTETAKRRIGRSEPSGGKIYCINTVSVASGNRDIEDVDVFRAEVWRFIPHGRNPGWYDTEYDANAF